MLTHREVLSILLDRGAIPPESLLEGRLSVTRLSHRNMCFKVVDADGPAVFVKQGIGPERAGTVAREAAVYEWLHEHGQGARFLPAFLGAVSESGIMMVEFIRDGESLSALAPNVRFSRKVASSLGETLGCLHGIVVADAACCVSKLGYAPPAPTFHRPTPAALANWSSGNLQVVHVVQRHPEFCDVLDDVVDDWRAEALIHGDIRDSNWIVSRRRGQKPRARLIDLEFAGWGDPAWDTGAIFAGYLAGWIDSIPIVGRTQPEQLPAPRYPLARIQPAIGVFWDTYRQAVSLPDEQAGPLLVRSVRYAAARLVQMAFERTRDTADLSGNDVCLLQVGFNLLQRPREAVAQLLGISTPGVGQP